MSGFTTTPNYGLRKPIVGADNDAWGGDINLDLDTLDTQLKAVSNAQANFVPLNGSAPMTGPLTLVSGAQFTLSNPAQLPARTYEYFWYDPTNAVPGGILKDGSLVWNAATITTLTATTATIPHLVGTVLVDTLTATAFTPASMTIGGNTLGTLDPRLYGWQYAWHDGMNVTGGVQQDGSLVWGNATIKALTLGGDPTAPGMAVSKSYFDANAVKTTGATMTGAFVLASDPTSPLMAATRSYVDAAAASGGAGGLAGLTAQRDYPYPPLRDPKRDFGAIGDGVADDTTAVMNCARAAIAAGERLFAVNDTFNVPNLTFDICDAIPVGSGRLITHPMGPNIWVAPPFAPAPPRRINSTFNLIAHAPHTTALLRAGTPVVAVVTGESTAAPAPNGFTPLANTWGRLPPAFNAANPGKTITWYNRAIGGQRWSDLNTVVNNPDTTVGWYTDPLRPWLDYIKDLAPDIVFIEFSGNDGAAFDITQMLSVITKLQAFPKVPDIAVITSNPYAQHYSTRGAFNTFENQCANATMERSWFLTHGMGVVDSFRTSVLGNRGIDIDDLPLLRDLAVTSGSVPARRMIPLPFTWPTRAWGYGGIFYVNVNSWATLGGEIQFPLGAHNNAAKNAGNLLRVGRDSATGNLYYSVDVTRVASGAAQDINFIPRTVVSNWPCGTGDMSFFLSVVGSKLVLQSGNQNTDAHTDQYITAFIGDIPRFAMPFQPVITCTAGAVSNALYFEKAGDGYATALSANPHPRTMYMPLLTDVEDHGTNTGVQPPQGGFGVGHDSVFKGIYARASCIDSCNFSAGS